MRLVLLGAPGCGKGTHSAWMIEALNVPQISTGDILRDSVAKGTELGQQAKTFMDSGQLVPDEVILGLVRDRLGQPDATRGFILDGFPRTIPQAEGLGTILSGRGEALDRVIKLEVDRAELVRRLTARRVCPGCRAVYNLDFRPPRRPGVCDACGTELVQRDDDREATVVRRLGVYEQQTAPLVEYYRQRGLLTAVDGNHGYASVRAEIERVVGGGADR
jgi:adenylate kinase